MRALLAITFLAVSALGQTRSTKLRFVVSPACALTNIVTTTASTTEGAQSVITGTTRFTYLLRTGNLDGAAEIRLEFAPVPDATLSYTTTLMKSGNSLSTNALTISKPAVVATFGSNAHTTRTGESGAIEWSLRAPLASAPTHPTLSITCR